MSAMRRLSACAIALGIGCGTAAPVLAQTPPAGLESACERAIAAAAAAYGVPYEVARSVGAVESNLHPFALNISGRSYFPSGWAAAEEIARAALTQGRQLDVGCMQINISKHHRDAFPSLRHALHPDWNADYGVRYLEALRRRHGDWTKAVANYHSGRLDAQRRYVSAVGAKMRAGAPAHVTPAAERVDEARRIRQTRANGAALVMRAERREGER